MAKKIKVGDSQIHGRGIFAKYKIKKGEIVAIIKGTPVFKINRTISDVFANPDWIGFKVHNWIDPIPPYKHINHSCEPNTAIKGKKTLIAIKDIDKNEEVTIDYSIIEADPRWYLKCDCGSKTCRGIITSIQKLPNKVYRQYFPHISKEFQSIYEGNPAIKIR
jgi:uncharacterized protein